jgi:hypothetical protein
MPSIALPPESLIAAVAGLIGALLGCLGGIGSQYVAHMMISRRESADRRRREDRILYAFRGMLTILKTTVETVVKMEFNVSAEIYLPSIEPLRRGLQDADLYLSLRSDQITALFNVLDGAEMTLLAIKRYEHHKALGVPSDALEYFRKVLIAAHQDNLGRCERCSKALAA